MNHTTITSQVFSSPFKKNMHGQLLLDVRGLVKSFGGHVVLNDLSVQLCRGEVVLLRGPNGSGKTTLLNILTGNIEPDSGLIHTYINGTSEHFRFPRPWWKELNPFDHFAPERVADEGIGRTWQDIRLFSSQTLEENVAVAAPHQEGEKPFNALFRFLKVNRQEKANLASSRKLLAGLGLGDRIQSSADKISLGQSKRVAIARAIQAGAKVLFLDEPLAGLDADGVNDIIDLLRNIAKSENLTLVIIEHVLNIPRILDIATTVWTLRDGKIIVESPKDVRSHYNNNSMNINSFIKIWSADANHSETMTIRGGAQLTIIGDRNSNKPVLEVKDLVVFRGKRLVIGEKQKGGNIYGLSFCFYKGQLAILQAPNGWGKTTLLESIAGIIPISKGKFFLKGKEVQNLPVWERVRKGISFLQAHGNIFPNLTVEEELTLSDINDIPSHLLPLCGRKISDLSGGERQLSSIESILKKDVSVLIADEPLQSLDYQTESLAVEILKRINAGVNLILIPAMTGQMQRNN